MEREGTIQDEHAWDPAMIHIPTQLRCIQTRSRPVVEKGNVVGNDDDGTDAILVQKNDVNGMVNAIRSIIENKSLASKLSTNARKKAQTFSWHNVKKSWKKLLL